MIPRPQDEAGLRTALERAPVVLLSGARQVGKTTLARAVVDPPRVALFDLDDPRDRDRLADPTLALAGLAGTVVIDEAQRVPDLFRALRVLVDEDRRPGRFLVLGSASPDLIGLASESLAGRVEILELGGFRLSDVGDDSGQRLWQRGGFPESFVARSDTDSAVWRDNFISTFLERDLANLGIRIPATEARRFWTMVAHFHGQTWNGAELARAMAVSQPTVRRYLDSLTDALVVRQLQPWFANISKRQVRSPKVYVRDSGLLHRLLNIADYDELVRHPKVGASWEGFAIEQILQTEVRDPWFWATQNGAEIDLVVTVGGKRVGVEAKRTDRPTMSPSIRHALVDLDLDRVAVVHAGLHRFALADRVEAVPLEAAVFDSF